MCFANRAAEGWMQLQRLELCRRSLAPKPGPASARVRAGIIQLASWGTTGLAKARTFSSRPRRDDTHACALLQGPGMVQTAISSVLFFMLFELCKAQLQARTAVAATKPCQVPPSCADALCRSRRAPRMAQPANDSVLGIALFESSARCSSSARERPRTACFSITFCHSALRALVCSSRQTMLQGPRVAQTAINSALFFVLFELCKAQLKREREAEDRMQPKLWTKRRHNVWKRQYMQS